MHQNLPRDSEAVAFTHWAYRSNISLKSDIISRKSLALLEASHSSTTPVSNEYHKDKNVCLKHL